MYRICYYIVFCAILLTGCIPIQTSVEPSRIPTPNNTYIDLPLADVAVRLYHLSGWNLYHDNQHIVLTEEVNPLNHQGDLEGIVMHLWLADITPEHATLDALNEILQKSDVDQANLLSDPIAFVWQEHDSAYYLLNSDMNNIALVLAVRVPDSDHLLAVNISVPGIDYERMRQLLPELFKGFAINHRLLDSADLHHIPMNISFSDKSRNS